MFLSVTLGYISSVTKLVGVDEWCVYDGGTEVWWLDSWWSHFWLRDYWISPVVVDPKARSMTSASRVTSSGDVKLNVIILVLWPVFIRVCCDWVGKSFLLPGWSQRWEKAGAFVATLKHTLFPSSMHHPQCQSACLDQNSCSDPSVVLILRCHRSLICSSTIRNQGLLSSLSNGQWFSEPSFL